MNIEQPLTKDNFFNEMSEKYPRATKHFYKWIDEYKKVVSWDKLFNGAYHKYSVDKSSNGKTTKIGDCPPKFHDIPYAMQYGIWIEYCRQELSNFF